jgi:hypothetical protein
MRSRTRRGATTARLQRWWAVMAIGFVLGSAWAGGLAAAPSARPDSTRRVHSIQDSPGWHYVVDPESASVLLGRRTSAPSVSRPFVGGARSMEDLGRIVCRSLHHTNRESLLSVCVSDSEFRDILWREFPESRPITGLTWLDAWISLDQRLQSGISGAISDYGGENWTFVGIASDSTYRYRNFKLHFGVRLVAIGDRGTKVDMTWLRTIAERRGRFKIYSTND